jgi:glucosyl-3-phosphoglycerate synthase
VRTGGPAAQGPLDVGLSEGLLVQDLGRHGGDTSGPGGRTPTCGLGCQCCAKFTDRSSTVPRSVVERAVPGPYLRDDTAATEEAPLTVGTAALRPPYSYRDFDLLELARARWRSGTRISVCLPARNEASTIGSIVSAIRTELVEGYGLVDEVVVLDDDSIDVTAERAELAGARVESVRSILSDLSPGSGKGNVMWKSLFAAQGDVICWMDADIRSFQTHLVWGLLGPLLLDPQIDLVKGFFRRPADGQPHGGGRVTELVARPLISKLFPELTGIVQPLAGATAGRREILESVPFLEGWGVEFALLVDVARQAGLHRIAQVDLGSIEHDRGTLRKLAPQALAVMTAAMRRAGLEASSDPSCELVRFDEDHVESVERVSVAERPPMATVAAYMALYAS